MIEDKDELRKAERNIIVAANMWVAMIEKGLTPKECDKICDDLVLSVIEWRRLKFPRK